MTDTVDGPGSAPTADGVTEPVTGARRLRSTRFDLEPYALPLAWLAIIILYSILLPSTFPTSANVTSMLSSQAVIVVVSIAVLPPLIVGDLDVSIGAVVGLSAMLTVILNVNHGVNALLAAAIAVAVSSVVGFVNGLLGTALNLDLLIITLATGSLVTGMVAWISGQQTFSGLSPTLIDAVVGKRIFGVSLEFYYAVALVLMMFYLFRYTPIGRRMLIVGQARDVAALSGVDVRRVRLGSMILCSALAGVAGVLYAGTSGSASPTGGTELLLPAYAAAFLGASTVTPGRFNAFGTLIAVYFLVTGITGLQLLGGKTFVQQLFFGGALIVAVGLAAFVRSRRERAAPVK